MVILLAAAVVGWQSGPDNQGEVRGFPALALVGVLVGFACVIAIYFRPMWARFLAPVYAVAEGFFLGVISKAYESYQDGIVLQAVGATLGVFAVMLVLYRTKIIKVTDRFRTVVITATMGLMVFYLFSFVLNLFGSGVPFLQSASGLGIAFSCVAAGLAALNRPSTRLHERVPSSLAEGHGVVCRPCLVVTLCGCTSNASSAQKLHADSRSVVGSPAGVGERRWRVLLRPVPERLENGRATEVGSRFCIRSTPTGP